MLRTYFPDLMQISHRHALLAQDQDYFPAPEFSPQCLLVYKVYEYPHGSIPLRCSWVATVTPTAWAVSGPVQLYWAYIRASSQRDRAH